MYNLPVRVKEDTILIATCTCFATSFFLSISEKCSYIRDCSCIHVYTTLYTHVHVHVHVKVWHL